MNGYAAPLFFLSVIIFLPFLAGIIILAKPWSGTRLLPTVCLSTTLLAMWMLFRGQIFLLTLTDSFGVRLLFDGFAWTFVLMNGLVFLGVFFSPAGRKLGDFALACMVMLHGAANAVFITHDLFNLFVCIELVSILTFLLIRSSGRPRQTWSAIQYLIISNVGMTVYLLGCLLAYNLTGSFSFETLSSLPKLPLYLLITGLSVKGGVFLAGLWLPEVHGESESDVSALLSGVIVNCGLAPLLRLSGLASAAYDVIVVLAVSSALFGIFYGCFEKDIKKLLAYSTVSQAGFILAFPPVGHLYALAHGLFKAWLFLSAGNLEARNMVELKKSGVTVQFWLPLFLGALAVSGMPGLGGFGVKSALFAGIKGWQTPWMYLAAAGTALAFAPLVFLPLATGGGLRQSIHWGNGIFLLPLIFLDIRIGIFSRENILKSLAIMLSGWLFYLLFLRNRVISLPKETERLENIIGAAFILLLVMTGVFGL